MTGPSCIFRISCSLLTNRGLHAAIRDWKLNYYVDYPPELFHLSDDPLSGKASNPKYKKILQNLIKELGAFVDPEATDRRAKDDQNRRLSEFGGAAKVLANELGTAGYTEVPTSILDKL